MSHMINVAGGRIYITPSNRRPVGFRQTDEAADFLAQVIMETRVEGILASGSCEDRQENGGRDFDISAFNDLVEAKLRESGVEVV